MRGRQTGVKGRRAAFRCQHARRASFPQVRVVTGERLLDYTARTTVLQRLLPLLTAQIPELAAERVAAYFEELPADRIALGSALLVDLRR